MSWWERSASSNTSYSGTNWGSNIHADFCAYRTDFPRFDYASVMDAYKEGYYLGDE